MLQGRAAAADGPFEIAQGAVRLGQVRVEIGAFGRSATARPISSTARA